MLLLMISLALFSVVTFIPSVCIAKRDTISSIYNGKPVAEIDGHEMLQGRPYTYAAILEFKGTAVCGSAIIGLNVLLTAAHCVEETLPVDLKIRAGTYMKGENIPDKVQLRSVKEYVIHNQYEKTGFGQLDIALVFVKHRFIMTEFVNVVKLASKAERDSSFEERVFLIGWGRTENGHLCKILKQAELVLLKRRQCKFVLDDKMHNSMLCAINENRDQGCCVGDSGGPLIKRASSHTGKDIMLGVASFMLPKEGNRAVCDPTYPTIFIDVVYVDSWIKKIIEQRCSPESKIVKTNKKWWKCF